MKLSLKNNIFVRALLFISVIILASYGCSKSGDGTAGSAESGITTGEKYSIEYQNGSDNAVGDKPAKTFAYAGQKVIISANTFVSFGSVFDGWSDGAYDYKPGDEVTMPDGGLELNAVWKNGGTYLIIDNCDSTDGWWGSSAITSKAEDMMEGGACNSVSGIDALVFCKKFDQILDISRFIDTGYVHLWFWTADSSLLRTEAETLGLIEFYDSQSKTYAVSLTSQVMKSGWNELWIPLCDAQATDADLSDITSFRLFQYVSEKTEIRMDDFKLWMPDESCTISFFGGEYDYLLGVNDSMDMKNVIANSEIPLPQNLFVKKGYDFIGWSDGEKTYKAGEEYSVPSGGSNLTAVWTEAEKFMVTYNYGERTASYQAYEGERVTVPSDAKREGYIFSGWSDGNKVYRSGTTYTMKNKKVTLTALWDKIGDYSLLSDAVGAWELREGGSAGIAPSAIGGIDLQSHWAVWLNSDTFGQVADFSTEGSYLYNENSDIKLGGSFTLSAWIKAPIRDGSDRTIMSQATSRDNAQWKMYIDGGTGSLAFSAQGLTGLTPGGLNITDGKWHHVMVTLDGDIFSYYVDSVKVKSENVTGNILNSGGDAFYIGGTAGGGEWFDGSIAQVRIYNSPKTPEETTAVSIAAADNAEKKPTLDTKKGVVIERLNGFSNMGVSAYEVYQPDKKYPNIDVTNVQAAKKFGMDHVKITVTPNNLIDKSGHLIVENMTYMTEDINIILSEGLPVIICFHPEPDYKNIYLGNLDNFELLCNWYREVAAYIGENWSPSQVSIQLMTEPYGNNSGVSWTWMSDRMYIAVRNELPDHTIITSSDSAGNIEYLKKMSPVTDPNIIYSFTTYEPYMIGFGTARSGMAGNVTFYNYLKNIPYPVPEGLSQAEIAQLANEICSLVPSEYHAEAIKTVSAYLNGAYDCDIFYKNNYSIGYTEDWEMTRMNSLTEWSEKYGGNIHMMCVEFGCMDSVTAKKYFGAVEGSGISEETRVRLIHDLRTAFEANNIGWSYWLFNGVFTVFDPQTRQKDVATDDAFISKAYDKDLIEYALGLTPDFSWAN